MNAAKNESGSLRLSGLAPLLGSAPRVLVLGSFPSAESLRRGEYYGFARNHFWELLAAVFGGAVPAGWAEKTAFLDRRGIALWDVVGSCEREGSLDQAIREAAANPIPALLRDLAGIERVVLNGSKAAELFLKRFSGAGADFGSGSIPLSPAAPAAWTIPGGQGRRVALIRVPSSSPVPSRDYRSIADKLPAWRAALAS